MEALLCDEIKDPDTRRHTQEASENPERGEVLIGRTKPIGEFFRGKSCQPKD